VRRVVLWTVVIVTALLLQSTVFSQITLARVQPDLVYVVTIVMAMLEGPATGAVTGFAAGMAEDFLLNLPKGITALTLTLLGYAIGTLRQYIVTPSALLPVLMVGGGTIGGIMFNGLVKFLLGQLTVPFPDLVRTALLAGAYNAILTPLCFPILRRVAEASRAKRVHRW
jgi:rod shape-determining protein MreD